MRKPRGFENELEAVSEVVETNVAGFVQVLNGAQVRPNPDNTRHAETTTDTAHNLADAESTSETGVSNSTRPPARSRRRAEPQNSQASVVVVNVTTRLTKETNELLTDAALTQRLKRQRPATRQSILEEAINDWLQKHNYRG